MDRSWTQVLVLVAPAHCEAATLAHSPLAFIEL